MRNPQPAIPRYLNKPPQVFVQFSEFDGAKTKQQIHCEFIVVVVTVVVVYRLQFRKAMHKIGF